jgi:leucyl-tRNA synthetase
MTNADTTPPHRYNAALANAIERAWQDRWESERTFWSPNPEGSLLDDVNADRATLPKLFVLDMFPYPSGAGLHVGHPLGFIGTDVYARFQRMNGRNVLHAMGMDAFGLPAEQYAVQTGQHPTVTTEQNIANYRAQLRGLGFGYDPRRGISTTDPHYYRWTQWIFLQIFNAWYDRSDDRARHIDELVGELDAGLRLPDDDGPPWAARDELARRAYLDAHRLAYVGEAPVNWCPGLGTVLANEEVTADGRSERGNFPVYKRPLSQWMMRITEYADRLLGDLDWLDWTESIKLMQRNWIGRSVGAEVDFAVVGHDLTIRVFTTRPDTLFGATYMVLAPEHELVDHIVPNDWPDDRDLIDVNEGKLGSWRGVFGAGRTPPEAVRAYREFAAAKSEVERASEGREKTGVFTGAFATNPTTGAPIPVFIADYVLMGYGTGAIMAVPGQDERDWEFAEAFELPIVRTVQPPDDWQGGAYTGDGAAINSTNADVSLNDLDVVDAKRVIIEWLEATGRGAGTVTYKLRDWLFSRQRYWGEPFPIVYDEHGPIALPDSMLPVELPEIENFEPTTSDDPDALPAPPLARAEDWVIVELDLGHGARPYRREVNTMPQWAGSCWYYLRYLDPTNELVMVDRGVERYWGGVPSGAMGRAGGGDGNFGTVDLYVGGVEHAVLHLLYARFWHKVLFDLGHVSTAEPFQRLYNQGYIQAYAYTDDRGVYVEASEVVERDGAFFHDGKPVDREYGKIGKSLKNVVTPDDMCAEYGADTFRMYEMFMGPLDASRPWNTRDVVGVHRFLQRFWRNCIDEDAGTPRVGNDAPDDDLRRLLHKTIAAVRHDYDALSFNTAIARLFELNNALTRAVDATGSAPREIAEPMVLMLAPLAPHISEELWQRLGHERSLAYEPFPVADDELLVDDTVEIPVQLNGKVRTKLMVATGTDRDALEAVARADAKVAELLDGKQIVKAVVVPGRMVNFVVR